MIPCFLTPGTNVLFLQLFLVYRSFPMPHLPDTLKFGNIFLSLAFSDIACLSLVRNVYISSRVLLLIHIESRKPQGLFKGTWVSLSGAIDRLNPVQMLTFIFIGFHLVSFTHSLHPVAILSPDSIILCVRISASFGPRKFARYSLYIFIIGDKTWNEWDWMLIPVTFHLICLPINLFI